MWKFVLLRLAMAVTAVDPTVDDQQNLAVAHMAPKGDLVPPFAMAQAAGIDDRITEELVGAPVFARDGSEVGEIADIFYDSEYQPRKLRIKAAAYLGLGHRSVDVPRGAFILGARGGDSRNAGRNNKRPAGIEQG